MKAIAVAEAGDVAEADPYVGVADYILFDAKAPSGATLPGGNGIPFDWRALKSFRTPFALSGGLSAVNVAEAVRLTGASLVDVSSGVERAPGEKDARLVRSFIEAAKAAQQQAKAS
jgi:phosphoribosylanthranilate isomerase